MPKILILHDNLLHEKADLAHCLGYLLKFSKYFTMFIFHYNYFIREMFCLLSKVLSIELIQGNEDFLCCSCLFALTVA